MPEYTYIDENDHTQTLSLPMFYSTAVICAACGLEMWRKPQTVAVNWGGLRPSIGELDPQIKHLIDTKDERREAFEEIHEEHEKHGNHPVPSFEEI
jgi:hypothetical protein